MSQHPSSAPSDTPLDPPEQGRMPKQIAYIIGNEACERFSFYGMRNILTQFLVSSVLLISASELLQMRSQFPDPAAISPTESAELKALEAKAQADAKEVFHTFVLGVYFFPLLGGWLADRFLGKYRTILYLSLVYCVGQGMLAFFHADKTLFFVGLFLIALGSGGIKPCVSAFVGDQFDQSNKSLAKIVFDAFYWIINFGSFFASLAMPSVLKNYGPTAAFGIPGILMFISTVILWLGRRLYVDVPPAPAHQDSFLRVIRTALVTGGPGRSRSGLALAITGFVLAVIGITMGFVDLVRMVVIDRHPYLGVAQWWCSGLVALIGCAGIGAWLQLERAVEKHGAEAVEGARHVLRILVLFALVTPFWSLFDQKASTWVLQAEKMTRPTWFTSSQMQALNPLLVMLIIPFNNLVLYPKLRKFGWEPTPLRRMTAGIAFSGLSWVAAGILQIWIDGGDSISIGFQVIPYALLTFGEVLVSATGLEFAYSQAPPPMKSAIMAFWSLSVTVGNLWVLLVNTAVRNDQVTSAISQTGIGLVTFLMFFFAAFAFVAALIFGMIAARYPVIDNYRKIGG